jgi:hypothetical protein
MNIEIDKTQNAKPQVEKKKKQFEEETRLKKINAGELAVEQMQKVRIRVVAYPGSCIEPYGRQRCRVLRSTRTRTGTRFSRRSTPASSPSSRCKRSGSCRERVPI